MTADISYTFNFGWLIENEIAGSRGPKSAEHLEFLRLQGIRALVRMSDKPGISHNEIKKMGFADCHQPVPDLMPPSPAQLDHMLDFISKCIAESKPVAVSCDGGIGRTATLLVCYLVMKGFNFDESVRQVKEKRPGSILTPEQQKAVEEYGLRLGRRE